MKGDFSAVETLGLRLPLSTGFCILTCTLWSFFLQGDFFTVEDLAYDYPTLNTL